MRGFPCLPQNTTVVTDRSFSGTKRVRTVLGSGRYLGLAVFFWGDAPHPPLSWRTGPTAKTATLPGPTTGTKTTGAAFDRDRAHFNGPSYGI